jgi:hypothetical protein
MMKSFRFGVTDINVESRLDVPHSPILTFLNSQPNSSPNMMHIDLCKIPFCLEQTSMHGKKVFKSSSF